ncbi:MAG: D-2-hydroxyacid dehydrogenase [Clostridia bacterium]|nr:D-2-hydroxyacid dehydrogenase [Clostridia bacterium]
MKIVVLDGFTLNPGDLSWEPLKLLGEAVIYDRTEEKDIISRIADAEIVFTNKTPLDKTVFSACPHIKWIGVLATGYNVIDIVAAKQAGILVANVPTYGTDSVAQYVFALLLEMCHHVKEHDLAVKTGKWSEQKDFCFWDFPLMELAGLTLGIIGTGEIGLRTAAIGKAFNMKVIAHSRTEKPSDFIEYADLKTLYKNADVISLHCPLTSETMHMIDEAVLDLMKPNVMIINTARGPLINEKAMAKALNQGKIAGYAADVVSVEPISKDHILLNAKNCILTPHIAWAPKAARERLMKTAIDNLKHYLEGNPIHIVNK